MSPRNVDNEAWNRVARLAGACEGVVTTQELVACGLTPAEVVTRVRHCTLHRIHQGVYAVGHADLLPDATCVAAVKACGPMALLSRSSSLAREGVISWRQGLPPEVTVLGSSLPSRNGIRLHRTSSMPPQDIRTSGCIRITSPARSLADMATDLSDGDLLDLMRRAHGKRVVNHTQLLSVHKRLGRRSGSARFARALALGPAPTRSVLESVVLDLILRGGLRRPDVNVPLVIEGRRVVPDFRWPDARLVVEADGATWHSGEAASEADAERQALLERSGERVERVTWSQAVQDPGKILHRIRAAGAPGA